MVKAETKKQFKEAFGWHVNSLSVLWHTIPPNKPDLLKRLQAVQKEAREIIEEVAELSDLPDE